RICLARTQAGRNMFAAIEEEWARQNSCNCASNSCFETGVLGTILVIGEQFCDVVVGNRPPVCTLCQRRNDLFSADSLRLRLRIFCRVAREDPVAAWRRCQTFCIVRAQKLERADTIHPILSAAGNEHLQLIVRLGESLSPERDANLVRPGSSGES